MEINRKIDVVIPVYNAFAVLQNCLASLELYQDGIENIILIDDASSDKNVVNLVRSYSKKNNWNLIKHDKNLGFVKTANEGLKISKNNTILLNSDTVVSEYWIQAFNKLLKNNSTIGTATAWSNNAEICSFPQFLQNNKIPKNLNRLSEILYKNYQPQYPEIPTAVGFCMLITKQAKQTIGYFDEKQFGHGYGEENDYSLRIKQAGLSNILCDNAYVVHIGNESFKDLGLKPNESTMKRLLEKHPNYNDMIGHYIKQDPLAVIRKELLDLIRNENKKLFQEFNII